MVKYSPTPYSITEKGMQAIVKVLQEENISSILEFGSGKSTDYLTQCGYSITSFDDDSRYASKQSGVKIKDLVTLTNTDFNKVLNGEITYYEVCNSLTPVTSRSSGQVNCFYKLDNLSLPSKVSFVLVDGPNGNGRSIAFRLIKEAIKVPCYVFIDDYFHYPFVENFLKIFPNSEKIIEEKESNVKGFVIFKINSIE